MESRSTWTDERLDDRFDHIDAELAHLRVEMRQGFSETRAEIGTLRGELQSEVGGLRGEINDLSTVMIRSNLAMMVALIGVIAAILVRGA